MAIVTWGALVAGVRGSVGGVTFSGNGAGPFVKSWARPAARHGVLQVVARRTLSVNAQAWAGLTLTQQGDWRTFGADPAQDQVNAFGVTYHLSGFQWFCKINGWLATVGRAAVSTPPTSTAPAAPTSTQVQILNYIPSATVSWDAGEYGTTYDLILEMVAPYSVGRGVPPAGIVVLGGWQTPGDGPIDVWAQMVARFGFIEDEQGAILYASRQLPDGYRSARGPVAVSK